MVVGRQRWEHRVSGWLIALFNFVTGGSVGTNHEEIVFSQAGVPESEADLLWRLAMLALSLERDEC